MRILYIHLLAAEEITKRFHFQDCHSHTHIHTEIKNQKESTNILSRYHLEKHSGRFDLGVVEGGCDGEMLRQDLKMALP